MLITDLVRQTEWFFHKNDFFLYSDLMYCLDTPGLFGMTPCAVKTQSIPISFKRGESICPFLALHLRNREECFIFFLSRGVSELM